MKFKIIQILIGGTFGSAIALGFLPLGWQSSTNAAVVRLAQALSPEEVNLRARQIIVRIDGGGIGSGSIVERSSNVYTVLTNWHVVKNSGDYVIQTIDGRKHRVAPDSIQQLPGLDLAILKFESNQNYQIAELGDANNLSEGQNVYFAGYPGELREEDNRYYRFFTANLVGILPKSTDKGYSLVYSGEAFPGMSGGPVFNKDGLMIGVHGEANIHAVSGGTSNYGIAIDRYQQAIAQLNGQPDTNTQTATETATSPETTQPDRPTEPPEVIVDVPPSESSQPETEASNIDSDKISSVPTFTSSNAPDNKPQPDEAANRQPAATPQESPSATQPAAEEIAFSTANRKISLISERTGIDYSKLRDLLEEGKWSEADLHTYQLVEQIVKTAKRQNKHVFIELKTIAEFSCPDIRTIDYLWKKHTNNKFGFSPQQDVWQSVNQKGDFSTQTWRRFATEVGWKTGEVASGEGYLLYDELDFEPAEAPAGHLPWWFALPDEEQKVIKHLFARCNFNPTVQELEAEARQNSNPSRNSANNSDRPSSSNEPNIDKPPKSDRQSSQG